MDASPLWIGTAGWSVASRYIADIPSGGSHLERYARRLNAVEINSSFYRPHQRKTYERWAHSVPDGFRFSVKMPQAITHERRLVGCDALLDRFIAEVTGLGDRLGVLLVQMPPTSAFEPRAADAFFRDLRQRIEIAVACEPRHPSWFAADADEFLVDRKIARVAADPARVAGAGVPGGWSGFSYYRWHGSPKIYHSNYDDAALTALGGRLDGERARHVPSWCIFDNTASGAALGNALQLTQAAGI